MKAIEELKKEHEGIMQMLLILEAVAGRLEREEPVPLDDLEAIVEFLAVFADRCHHGKEEKHLFPALEKSGLPPEGHPVETLLAEHRKGRELIAAMKRGLSRIKAGDAEGMQTFAEAASRYMDLLELHIEKENSILFPLAETRLAPRRDSELLDAFEKLEEEEIGPGRHEAFHALLRRLKKTWLQ
jgi:hemerythrin-like domain-containing protein